MGSFNKVLMIGCGAIGKATLLYWDTIIPHIKYGSMVIIEPTDLPFALPTKIQHLKVGVTKDNYSKLLDSINPDFVIDLSMNVDTLSIINYCQDRNIPYFSTAMEDWNTFPDWDERRDMYAHSLLIKQRIAMMNNDRLGKHPTALIDHGMNPGMISHFAKLGIANMARDEGITFTTYAEAAAKLGVCVIQCSEVDTQRMNSGSVPPDTFLNTWSALGFIEEALDPVQVGWGSHEEEFDQALGVKGDDEQRYVPIRGMDLQVRGYNPLVGEYSGYCIPHGESASLPRYLTYKYPDGNEIYRPSAYYVYLPSHPAIESINNLRSRNYAAQPHYRVITTDEIQDGHDAVGALLIRSDGRCYWSGTIITKTDVFPEFLPYTNPTCLQVVCGVLSGIDYVAHHKNEGCIFAESVETNRVFELTSKYLGKIITQYVDVKLPTKFKDLIVK